MEQENGILLLSYIFLSHGNEKKRRVGCKKGGCCVLSTSTCEFGLNILYSLIFQLDSAAFTDYVGTSFKYSILLFYYFFLPAASFLNAALCWTICVWILNKSPKRHLPRGFLFRSIHSPPFYACMSQFILVCNFACDLCCFIVNAYSVKSSLELMLYCFIMFRIQIKFSYLIRKKSCNRLSLQIHIYS